MAIANPTPIIGLERQVNGTNSNTWNDRYTANWLRLEDAVASSVSVNVAAGDVTLTTADTGDTNHDAQNRYSVIIATGAPVAARNVIWSAALTSKRYLLVNSTGQNVTFKVTAQTGVTLAAGARIAAWCNGTDIVAESVGYSASLASVTTTGAATIGNGLTVTTGGATVSAGGINVTGNSTITGTLGGLTALTMTSGLITASASGIKFSDNTTQTTAAASPSGALISSGYTQSTARLIGRTTAGTGAPEEITVGVGLSFSAGSLATSGAYTAAGYTMTTARLLGRTTAGTGAAEEVSIGTGLALAAGVLSSTVGVLSQTTYTATGANTVTKPAGANWALVELWGAGGSGSRQSNAGNTDGGGGGGYFKFLVLASALSATETLTVGTGGVARTGSNQAGAAGGNTTFTIGGIVGATTNGGLGGGASGNAAGTGGLGLGGSSLNANIISLQYENGATGAGAITPVNATSCITSGGGGGASGVSASTPFWLGSGAGGALNTNGSAPAGGGGGSQTTSGAGGDGRGRVTWF